MQNRAINDILKGISDIADTKRFISETVENLNFVQSLRLALELERIHMYDSLSTYGATYELEDLWFQIQNSKFIMFEMMRGEVFSFRTTRTDENDSPAELDYKKLHSHRAINNISYANNSMNTDDDLEKYIKLYIENVENNPKTIYRKHLGNVYIIETQFLIKYILEYKVVENNIPYWPGMLSYEKFKKREIDD